MPSQLSGGKQEESKMGRRYEMTKERIAEIDELLEKRVSWEEGIKLIKDLDWEYSHYVTQKFLNNQRDLKVISL